VIEVEAYARTASAKRPHQRVTGPAAAGLDQVALVLLAEVFGLGAEHITQWRSTATTGSPRSGPPRHRDQDGQPLHRGSEWPVCSQVWRARVSPRLVQVCGSALQRRRRSSRQRSRATDRRVASRVTSPAWSTRPFADKCATRAIRPGSAAPSRRRRTGYELACTGHRISLELVSDMNQSVDTWNLAGKELFSIVGCSGAMSSTGAPGFRDAQS
jgi:hypothetical protein